MSKTRIEGVLTLISPLHVASPEEASVDIKTGRIRSGRKQAEEFPITVTQKAPLLFSEELLRDSESQPLAEGAMVASIPRVPVIPSNSFRGKMRRHAATLLFDVLQARGELLTGGAYRGILCGSVTGQPKGTLSYAEAIRARKHPFIGTFGGGPRLISSNFRVGVPYPITKDTLTLGIVPERFASYATDAKPFQLTTPLWFRHMDDMLNGRDAGCAVVANYADEVAKWIDESKSKLDEGGNHERNKAQIQGYNAIEIVSAGLSFHSLFEINTVHNGDASLGLFLESLTRLVNEQSLGGWTRNGMGRYKADYLMTTEDGSSSPLFKSTSTPFELNLDFEPIATAMDAWAKAADELTAAEIEELFALPVEKEAKKTKK